MGVCGSVDEETPAQRRPTALPAKKAVPRENLVQRGLTGAEIRRGPGDIGGNEFMVDELRNCKVVVTDVCDSMMIDRCVNCELILAAVRGSVFVRDSEGSRFQIVCGQFRCRDCANCDFFMHAKTGPVVESSRDIRIGCSTLFYPELAEQMREAGLDPAANGWTDVHDFTPGEGHFVCRSGEVCDLPMMDRSGFLLPFTRIAEPALQTFRFRIKEREIAKLSQTSTFSDVKLIGVAREGGDLVATFQGQSRQEVEARITSLEPVPC